MGNVPMGSCIWILGPQVMVLFGEVAQSWSGLWEFVSSISCSLSVFLVEVVICLFLLQLPALIPIQQLLDLSGTINQNKLSSLSCLLFMVFVQVRVSLTVKKYHEQKKKQARKERGLLILPDLDPSLEEVRQELNHAALESWGRSWSRSHRKELLIGLLLLACSACPSYRTEDYQTRNGAPHNRLGLPPLYIEKMPTSHGGIYSTWGSFLCDD